MASFRRFFSRHALDRGRRRLRRTTRRLIGLQRMVLVPLLDAEQTQHALDLACRLASDRGSRVLLLAPLYVDWELPLDAHFKREEAALRVELGRERAIAESYGVGAHTQIVRARPGELGRGVAEAAVEVRASLIVVGSPVDSQRGFRRPFSRDVWSVLNDAPCPVMIATGTPQRAERAVA
ncbi:MAG: universal stress protein [Actinobacteria bacterium]|nr:MAG: universal stress protein [Actinomycetota bacterium]